MDGKIIVISGPSGAGKTSICNALLEQLPNTIWSVSATTRPPRSGETDGVSYRFLSSGEFEAIEAAGEFAESAEYVGHKYGTPRKPLEEAIAVGKNVVVEIDVQGGMQIASALPESVRIFVMPPNETSLRARLEGRKTEAKEVLNERLAQADGEIAIARDSGCYDHFVVNDVLEKTIEDVKRIVQENTRA